MPTREQRLLKKAEEIGKLLYLQVHDKLTPVQKQILMRWWYKQDILTQKYLEHITDWTQIEDDLITLASINVEKAWQEIRERMKDGGNPS